MEATVAFGFLVWGVTALIVMAAKSPAIVGRTGYVEEMPGDEE